MTEPKRLTVRLSPPVYREMEKHARRLGLSKRAFIEQVLRGYMMMETVQTKIDLFLTDLFQSV